MYQVFARKYRPQAFSELVNQEHVRTTLENAIAQNRIAHGYIFSGQRGTGKTTVARILARCLNCVEGPTNTPCGTCASCREVAAGNAPDVIEIDAASNRGINEMRELRENVRYRPARDRYKVFIIDEAHQITSEAFNALLKTLEEPPEWVVFVLCTTEAHKIPATIASRCQHFSFRSVGFDEIAAHMRWICEQEGIQADDEALAVLAQVGEGSVRDSLSALDQAIACCGTVLKAEDVRALLGAYSLDTLAQITQALADRDSARMLDIVDNLVRNGRHLQHFVRELARYFRNLLVIKIAGDNPRLVPASDQERERLASIAASFSEQDLTRYLQLTMDLFRDLQFSWNPRLHTELGLVRLVEAGKLLPIEEALASVGNAAPPAPPAPPAPKAGRSTGPSARHEAQAQPAAQVQPEAQVEKPAPAPGGLQQRLVAALRELGMAFTADAVEQSAMVEAAGELRFTTPPNLMLAMQSADIQKGLEHLKAGRWKIKVAPGNAGTAKPEPRPEAQPAGDDETMRRALAHPEVQRFRELFPDSEVRVVRNLKI
ncbi:MAG TPA: DNA polymerase III subunit gamma/tau [Bryobacteraceae bacterium]|nr:DNA polymerase III subunit gamma/tau [Bryobacteraceae bacterium]HOQ45572.1 DNA polymerase III subunit gamma/tau [Bryobacteraceae bacterium]HPU73390.1 DNA polymerase III subunit gamma/tau [Bryobacteraceae bacterium]